MKLKNKLKGSNPIIPAFFVRLQPFLNQVSSWESISETNFIRIEKQLKARSRKVNQFERDDNEKFLSAIKQHGRAIDLILNDGILGKLVIGKRFHELDFPFFMPSDKEDYKLVCKFMKEHLEADLLEQFIASILRYDYKPVLVWLRNCAFFSPGFKQKMEALLDSQLSLIEETLSAKPQSFQLNSNIPFAQNPEFYKLMNYYASRSLDFKIIQIVDWIDRHSTYSDSSSFIKNMLEAMVEYHTANASLQSYRVVVNALIRKEEKSVLVVILVGLSLLIAFVFFVFNSIHPKPPGPYVWPKDEYAAEAVQSRYNQVINMPKQTLSGFQRIKSDSFIKQLKELYFGGTGIEINEDSLTVWKTGEGPKSLSEWCQPLPQTPKQSFKFINQTRHDLMFLSYFNQCYYPSFQGVFPCKTPVAYNITLVKAGDSLDLSARFIDRFYIQTGPVLKHWKLSIPFGFDALNNGYTFCDVREKDSLLLTYELKNMGENKSKGGRLVLREKKTWFSLCWEAPTEAIYLQNKRTYLQAFKPFVIN